MLSINSSALQRRTNTALQNATYDPKKLVLLHTSVTLGSSLLVAVVNMLLSLQIADTGGLSGLGLRSILSTIQSVLTFIVTVGLPFWQIGIIFAALRWSREEEAGPKTLLRGFLQFRSVLGLYLLRALIFALLGVLVFYIGSLIFMLTPLSEPIWDVFEPLVNGSMTSQEMEAYLTAERLNATMKHLLPMLGISVVLYAVIAIPLFYRLRFVEYALADGASATKALSISFRLTKKKCIGLFKLDLHFWWYYLVLVLLTVLNSGNDILSEAGVAMPFSTEVGTVVFYLAATAGQIAFCCRYQATISTTYAFAYQMYRGELSADALHPTPIDAPQSN